MSKLVDIEFGLPHLRRTGRGIKYELEGVAFIEGYEKTVGFTFECRKRNWSLMIDDLFQSKEVYNFFNKLFKNCLESNLGISKSMLGLSAEWMIVEDKIQEVLDRIENVLGIEWKDCFKTLINNK